MGYVKKYVAEDRKRYLVVPCGKEKKDSKFSQRQRTWNKYQPYAYIEVDRLCHNLTAKKKKLCSAIVSQPNSKSKQFLCSRKKKVFAFFSFVVFFCVTQIKKNKRQKTKDKKKMCQLRVFGRKKERRREKGTKLGLVLGLVLELLNGVWVYNFSLKQIEESEKNEEDKVWLGRAIISTAG